MDKNKKTLIPEILFVHRCIGMFTSSRDAMQLHHVNQYEAI